MLPTVWNIINLEELEKTWSSSIQELLSKSLIFLGCTTAKDSKQISFHIYPFAIHSPHEVSRNFSPLELFRGFYLLTPFLSPLPGMSWLLPASKICLHCIAHSFLHTETFLLFSPELCLLFLLPTVLFQLTHFRSSFPWLLPAQCLLRRNKNPKHLS